MLLLRCAPAPALCSCSSCSLQVASPGTTPHLSANPSLRIPDLPANFCSVLRFPLRCRYHNFGDRLLAVVSKAGQDYLILMFSNYYLVLYCHSLPLLETDYSGEDKICFFISWSKLHSIWKYSLKQLNYFSIFFFWPLSFSNYKNIKFFIGNLSIAQFNFKLCLFIRYVNKI